MYVCIQHEHLHFSLDNGGLGAKLNMLHMFLLCRRGGQTVPHPQPPQSSADALVWPSPQSTLHVVRSAVPLALLQRRPTLTGMMMMRRKT